MTHHVADVVMTLPHMEILAMRHSSDTSVIHHHVMQTLPAIHQMWRGMDELRQNDDDDDVLV